MDARYVFDIAEQRSGPFDTLAGVLLYALGNRYKEFSVTRIERRFFRTVETLLVTKADSLSLIQGFRNGRS